MKTVLVTGGTGFIGSHTVVSLLLNGYRVLVIDSNINSSPKVLKRIKLIMENINPEKYQNLRFFKGDLKNYDFLENIFLNYLKKGIQIDAVIHFSGLKCVSQSIKKPLNYWNENICGTINLLKIIDKYNCNNLIFSSSASVYGEKNQMPIKEFYDLSPSNPYANTKEAIERMINDFYKSKSDDLNIIILRYFNPIGAHNSGLMGEDPLGIPNNLFPLILRAVSKNEKLLIFGRDWPTKDGTCIRDYIHIEDLAEAHVNALDSQFTFNKGIFYFNLGTGKGTSVLELIKTFQEINNVNIKYEFVKRRKGDIASLFADNSYAISKLNWHPSRSISEMCKDGYRWIRKNPNGYGN